MTLSSSERATGVSGITLSHKRADRNDEILHRSFGGWADQVQLRGGIWRVGDRSSVRVRSQEVMKLEVEDETQQGITTTPHGSD